ncbi:MAG: hypothetical protein IJ837_03270 [Clostridia bacterium]|nr:hypothetical protein [Clostridia bacterium]
MQEDFHYYATYCAAYIAGYNHEDCLKICYGAQLVDLCSKTFLTKIGGPTQAATTQLSLEMMDIRKDVLGLQEITRIWASFHFLPYDLNRTPDKKVPKKYLYKYRLICDTNSDLLVDTINLAKDKGLEAIGLSVHILADTWAHRYFAGTPSLVINSPSGFVELVEGKNGLEERKLKFRNSPFKPDDLKKNIFTCSMLQADENAIMNLGHGRAGHLPDYGFMRYKYMPAWKNYEEIIKDNPKDYYNAFCQMVYAFKFFRGEIKSFKKNTYAFEDVEKYKERINNILKVRRLSMSEDWKAFGEMLSNEKIESFKLFKYEKEYVQSSEKSNTYLGRFILAALAQKSMVTNRIYKSKNPLAGISVDYEKNGLKGMKEYFALLKTIKGGEK